LKVKIKIITVNIASAWTSGRILEHALDHIYINTHIDCIFLLGPRKYTIQGALFCTFTCVDSVSSIQILQWSNEIWFSKKAKLFNIKADYMV
jgi:hypothetical protein